jgi:hypothetical protein
MQVKFRQTTKNGCGSLSIANIFDDHRFTTGLEKLPGERIADLNLKLAEMEINGIQLFVDCIFMTQKDFRIGNRLKICNEVLFAMPRKGLTKHVRETYAVPYLMTIANGYGRNPHMVGVVYNIKDKKFYVIDSTKPDVIVLTYRELIKRFHIISVSLFRQMNHPEHGNFITMPKEDLPHIFHAKS